MPVKEQAAGGQLIFGLGAPMGGRHPSRVAWTEVQRMCLGRIEERCAQYDPAIIDKTRIDADASCYAEQIANRTLSC